MFGPKHQQRVRHQRLMRAASTLVNPVRLRPGTPAELVALTFGQYQMEITEVEAERYLDAALVGRGYSLRMVDVDEVVPGPDADQPESPGQPAAAS